MATVALRRCGVFVREEDLWSQLDRVKKLVFDKTGTLTLETPVLQNPEALHALDAGERAMLLSLVRDSAHPVSQCLLENLLSAGESTAAISNDPGEGEINETVGCGVERGPWSLGRAGWRTANPGDETMFVRAGRVLAKFHFIDSARPDAKAELAALGRQGFSTFILSGDRAAKVHSLAADRGLQPANVVGELTPHGKADWLDENTADDALMLGDGANDSLAFDRALCRGTPVVHRGMLERKADFYYLGRGIGGLRALFAVNDLRRRTQRAALIFSVVYNALAVGLAVVGRMNPMIAAALMPLNSLLTLGLVTGGMRRAIGIKSMPV